MNDPNKTPQILVVGTVLGAILTLGPVAGLLGTVIAMMRAFNVLGSSGIADPRALAESISHALFWTASGLALVVIGLPLLITCSVLWVYHLQSVRGQR
jgi:biopolymer transport protein ExbB/TolQ